MWLDCPVVETDERGRKTRTTEARDKRRGIPQGSPLSPLLGGSYPLPHLYETCGLVRLTRLGRNVPWATA
jgi:hypothetical protein